MELDIDGSSLVRRLTVHRHIETEASRRLAPFADRIGAVRVRLRERASTTPTRALCGIGVTLEPRDAAAGAWVLGRAEDDDPCAAVDRALGHIVKALGEEILRRDREQASRTRALLDFAQTGVVHRA